MISAPTTYLVLVTDLGPTSTPGMVPGASQIPKIGHRFQLMPGKNIIGREAAPDIAIVVPAMAISRRHAQVDFMSTGFWEIADLQSRNGTILNGQRLQPHSITLLREGDRIEIAHVQLLFTCQTDQTDPKFPSTQANPTGEELETWLQGPYMNGDH